MLDLQVTERDDRMLMEQLTALEAANKEVAGDTDSEEDDDTGMLRLSCTQTPLRRHTIPFM